MLPETNFLLSADYPGELARKFEGGDLEVLGFAAGGVGSSNPRHGDEHMNLLVDPLVSALGRGLSKAQAESKATGALASAQVQVPIPPFRYRVSRETMLLPWVTALLIGREDVSFGAIAIDDVLLLHLPVELSGELSDRARMRARKKGLRLAPLTFNGSYIGYVVSSRVYDLPEEKGEEMLSYETQVMTFLGPWGADFALNLGLRLASAVHKATVRPTWPGHMRRSSARP
jgi:hypothetical protein